MDSNFQTPPRQIISSQQEQDSNDPEKTWQTIQSSQSFVPYLTEKSTDRPYNPSSQKNYSRIVCMSDTHGKHRDIDLPKGDILIHGGDFTRSGEKETISDVSRYFGELLEQHKFQQIICIAGNHELTFDDDHYKDVHEHFHSSPMDCSASRNALKNCIYLQDSSCNIHSMEIYGTPWTPFYYNWGFQQTRGYESRNRWRGIPSTTDILISHGPPLGRGDEVPHVGKVGCVDLLQEVQERLRPRVHIFGHIHEGYGISSDGTTLFVNPSSVTKQYRPCNPCIVLDVPHDITQPPIVVQPHSNLSADEVISWFDSYEFSSPLVPYLASLQNPLDGNTFVHSTFDEIRDILQITSRKDLKALMKSFVKFNADCF